MAFGAIKDLFFKITAKDESARGFSSVNKRLRETDGLAASVNERVGRAGKSMQKFGAAGSVASVGIAAAFRDVIGLYDEQARAEAKVTQAILATGGAAGFSSEKLFEQASALQEISRFGDEDILNNVTAQLLTFKNISGEAFTDAQKAALNLSTILDGDLQAAAIMLGKALDDPIKGLSAMSRAGVTFSQTQVDVIKDLAKTGDIAGAQRLILDQIATSYIGQAEAARDAGAGILDAWSNAWGDIKEDIGEVVVQALPPLIEGLKSVTGWFSELTPEGRKTAVMLGALAIAIPPITIALGVMVSAVAALSGPIGIAIAAIAGLTAAAALLWPEKNKVSSSAVTLTAALGDEITQSQLLSEVISGSNQMSVAAARQKLAEAQSRHENVKAIIAENRALALQSDDYQSLLKDIQVTQDAINSLGNGARDTAPIMNQESFENAQLRLVELRKRQQEYLRAGKDYEDQLKRTEENISTLEAALTGATSGTVTLGGGVTPIVAGDFEVGGLSLDSETASVDSLTAALKDLSAETDSYAESESWGLVKDNLKALAVDGQSWSDTWRGIFSNAMDRVFDLAFSPAWDALFDNLDSFLTKSTSGGGGSATSGLLGGIIGGASNWVGNILGLDTGGDVQVSGKAGVDRNMTVLRTSDAETVSVRRKGDASARPVTVNIYTQDLRSFQGSQAQVAGQMRRALSVAERAS